MATLGRGNHTACRGLVHGGCVHACSDADNQHGRPRLLWAGDLGAQKLGRDMAKGVALRLQVIQNRRTIGTRRAD